MVGERSERWRRSRRRSLRPVAKNRLRGKTEGIAPRIDRGARVSVHQVPRPKQQFIAFKTDYVLGLNDPNHCHQMTLLRLFFIVDQVR